jgi:hypothetical protein
MVSSCMNDTWVNLQAYGAWIGSGVNRGVIVTFGARQKQVFLELVHQLDRETQYQWKRTALLRYSGVIGI